MKKLIKKGNFEFKNIVLEALQNQPVLCKNNYYQIVEDDYIYILRSMNFSVSFFPKKLVSFEERKYFLNYIDQIGDEILSFNNEKITKEIIEPKIIQVIQDRLNVQITNLKRVDENEINNFIYFFEYKNETLKNQSVSFSPYCIYKNSAVKSDYVDFNICVLIEIKKEVNEFKQSQEKEKNQIETYIEDFLYNSDFLYRKIKRDNDVTISQIMYSFFLFSGHESRNENNIHVPQYFTYRDFTSQFTNFFKEKALDAAQKLFYQSNIFMKQKIRNFIKRETSEDIEKNKSMD